MSEVEDSRIAASTLLDLLERRFDAAAARIAEDLEWRMPSDTPSQPDRVFGRDAALDRCRMLASIFPGGLDITIAGTTAQQGRVAIEYSYTGETAAGDAYENSHCSVWTIRDGLVTAIYEYADSARAALLFPRALAAVSAV